MLHKHNSAVTPEQIESWVKSIAYQLDHPSVVTLNEITAHVKDWAQNPDHIRACHVMPVEYSAMVANLGVAILYDELNANHPDCIAERVYFPEKKLLARLKKEGIPLFSKENFVPLQNFEALMFSSYYPVQYFNVPVMLELSNIPVWSKDRDGSNAPIILGGGISFYNPEPVSDFFDAFFIGEGENKLYDVLKIMKECRVEGNGIDKEKYLWRLAKETDFMYVPSFYEVKYFDGFGVKSRKALNEVAKPVITRAIANIYETKALTRTFVPVTDSADMSIGSVECTRGCAASPISVNTPVFTSKGLQKFGEVEVGDRIFRNGELLTVKEVFDRGYNKVFDLYTKDNYCLTLEPTHEVQVMSEDGKLHDVEAQNIKPSDFMLISRARRSSTSVNSEKLIIAASLGFLHSAIYRDKADNLLSFTFEDISEEMLARFCSQIQRLTLKADDLTILRKRNKVVVHLAGDLFKKFDSMFEKTLSSSLSEFTFKAVKEMELFVSFYSTSRSTFNRRTRTIKIMAKNEKEAYLVQFYLLSMGIISSTKKNVVLISDSKSVTRAAQFTLSSKDYLRYAEVPEFNNDSIPYIHNRILDLIKGEDSEYYSNIRRLVKRLVKNDHLKVTHAQLILSQIVDLVYQPEVLEMQKLLRENFYYSKFGERSVAHYENTKCVDVGNPHHFDAAGIQVHNCNFCEGSARTMPLRERGTEDILKAMDEVQRETGVLDITPYGFNLSDHSNIRTIVKYLAKNQDIKIQMSSQRIDMFTEDFAALAYASGNRSLTLAIEGGSERIRRSINKNLTKQQILEAFEIALKVGFNKIKIYMIANLPFETPEDIAGGEDSLVGLMEAIAARRDYWANVHGKETAIRWSFTPFTSKNGTPFEFAECMGGLTNKKTLTPAVEAARKYGFKFRVGTSAEISTIAQVLTLGDRRLNNVIYRGIKEGVIQYFGGMSCGKDVLEPFAKILAEETGGHTYETYGQEKYMHVAFPWDFIDIGMTKEHRKERYLQAKQAVVSPFGCFNRCVQCGACMTSQKDLPKTPSGKDYTPTLWRKEVANNDTLDDIQTILLKAKKPDVQRFILEFETDSILRFLDRSKIKLYLQRAFIRNGFQARKKKSLLSDKFRFQNWTYGKDYCVGQLTEKILGSSEEILESLKKDLEPFGIHPTKLEIYSLQVKAADVFNYVLYEVQTDFDISKVKQAIEDYSNSAQFLVKIKVPGLMQDSWVTKEVDAKEFVKDLWAESVEGVTVIRMISSENIGMYEVLPSLLKTSAKNIKRFPVRRLEYLKSAPVGEIDFFANTCEVCGEQIEKNVFGEPIHEQFCARHLPFTLQVKESLGADVDEVADAEAEAIQTDSGVYMENDGSTLDASFEDETPSIDD